MEELKSILSESLPKWEIGKLLRSSESLNFNEVESIVKNSLEYLTLLNENFNFFESIPEQEKDVAANATRQMVDALNRMDGFTVQPETNFQDEYRNTISTLKESYPEFYNRIVLPLRSLITLAAIQSKGLTESVRKIKSGAKKAEEIEAQLEQIKKDAQIAAGKTSVATFHQIFLDEAGEHSEEASKWYGRIKWTLCAVATIGVIFVALAIWVFEGLNVQALIAILTVKLVILSGAIYALRVCVKNYGAHKHLETQNKHRANVLKALPAFIDAVGEENKDFMFSAGAKAAFEAGETGLISVKEGAGSSDNELSLSLLDLLRKQAK